jgi:hypothetical protein
MTNQLKNPDEIFVYIMKHIEFTSPQHSDGIRGLPQPDKWDFIAALFMTAAVVATTIGLAFGASYIISSLSASGVAASLIATVSSDPKGTVDKLMKFIKACMPWLLVTSPLTAVTSVHTKTKAFLIEHFSTAKEFENFLQAAAQ